MVLRRLYIKVRQEQAKCSQEVGNDIAVRHRALTVVDGQEDFVLTFEMRVDLEDGGHVVASVAVVRSRPDGDEALSEPISEAVHNKLMCAGDQLEIVDVIELVGNARAEEPSSTTWRQ